MIDHIGDVDLLVVGAGFAGASVASSVRGRDVLVLDRGEPLDVTSASAAALEALGHAAPRRHRLDLEPQPLSEWLQMRSLLPENQVRLPLSGMCGNVYTFRQGGISNWWGGHVQRITQATFEKSGDLCWPVRPSELESFIQSAVDLMHVHGDRGASNLAIGDLGGAAWWREKLSGIFPRAHITSMARNVSRHNSSSFGLCIGRGTCSLCQEDAKARASNTYPNVNVQHSSRVEEVHFDGSRAVAVTVRSEDALYRLGLDTLVIAGGGLENVALLKRSVLPNETPTRLIGQRYQDHCEARIIARLPFRVPRLFGDTHADIEIPELSGYFGEIEVKTLLYNGPANPQAFASAYAQSATTPWRRAQIGADVGSMAEFMLQIEIPPEWGLELRARGHDAFVKTMNYWRRLPEIDLATLAVMERMQDVGIEIMSVAPNYRGAFFGCHFTGTTPMSANENAVLTPELRLIGTDNVYVSGGSAIPRCGGAGPTLMINALGLRLGKHLSRS